VPDRQTACSRLRRVTWRGPCRRRIGETVFCTVSPIWHVEWETWILFGDLKKVPISSYGRVHATCICTACEAIVTPLLEEQAACEFNVALAQSARTHRRGSRKQAIPETKVH
jgi:hypothetical protein